MSKLEAHLLCSINHANVLRGHGYGLADLVDGSADETMKQSGCGTKLPFKVQKVKARNILYIAMELAQEFDLNSYLEQTGGFLEFHALQLFHQFVSGIKATHDAGFTNRDLKVSNILIDNNYNLCISDFGLSAPLKGCSCSHQRHSLENGSCQGMGKLHGIVGTEGQLAPEINAHLGELYVPNGYDGRAVDMFNAGIVLFNLLFAQGPFYSTSSDDSYYGYLARNEGP